MITQPFNTNVDCVQHFYVMRSVLSLISATSISWWPNGNGKDIREMYKELTGEKHGHG